MQFVTRLISLTRAMQLRRQLREVGQMIESLTPATRRQFASLALRELTNASRSEFPHLYGTPAEDKYRAWGSGTEIGLGRLRSDNLQVRLRGGALWLVVAYHETRNSPYSEQQELHRQLMRTMRTLREMVPAEELQQQGLVADIEAA